MNNNNKRPKFSSGNNTKKPKVAGPKSGSSQGTGGKVKFNKESFLRSLKDLKLYIEGDRYYESAKVKVGTLELDWD